MDSEAVAPAWIPVFQCHVCKSKCFLIGLMLAVPIIYIFVASSSAMLASGHDNVLSDVMLDDITLQVNWMRRRWNVITYNLVKYADVSNHPTSLETGQCVS